jgi:hypothetical protein
MTIKFDNKLFKYAIILIVVYLLVSKIPIDKIPRKNPLIMICVVFFFLFVLDQPNVLFENFNTETTQIQKSLPLPQPLPEPPLDVIIQQQQFLKEQQLQDQLKQVQEIQMKENLEKQKEQQLQDQLKQVQEIQMKENLEKQKQQQEVAKLLQSNDILKNAFKEALTEIYSDPSKKSSPPSPSKVATVPHQYTGLPSKQDIIKDTISANKAENCNCDDVAEKAVTKFLKNRRLLDKNGLLHYADDYIGDMGYSQLRLDNYIPLGASGNGVYNSWDLGKYNVLNTDRWKPSGVNTLQCKTDKMPEPQPVDSKMPLNLLNWDYSRKVMPHDQININYINDKLNN